MISDDGRTDTAAVFFDVDGTLTKTTIVHHYVYFRRRRMSPLVGRIWYGLFLLKCLYYLVLDRIDRSLLNIVFYRSYAGLHAESIKNQATDCYRAIILPRQFEQVAECVEQHRTAGHTIVLVTGSLDFIIEPFARALAVDAVVAPSLVESNGRFTGKLNGPPIGDKEKARRITQFAENHGIDLSRSHAYGDSIADLPMLDCVGHAHVVNPDRRLAGVAQGNGWSTHHWTVKGSNKMNNR